MTVKEVGQEREPTLAVETCGVRLNVFPECQFQPEFSRTSQSIACSLKGDTLVYFVHSCIHGT